MTYHEPSADDFLQLDPEPDDDAWEAYLDFVMPLIGSADANGLDARAIARLEDALGVQLPYEVGLFLTIGVPSGDAWWTWNDDVESKLAEWDSIVVDGLAFAVEQDALWLPSWADRPSTAEARRELIAAAVAGSLRLLPLYGSQAIAVGRAVGATSDARNPVFRVDGTDVDVHGDDLAAWLHKEFDAPLPMWPAPEPRSFAMWSDLVDSAQAGDGGAAME